MDFAFTAEEQAFRAKVRAFAEREWGPPAPMAAAIIPTARRSRIPPPLCEAGYVTFGWPKNMAASPQGRWNTTSSARR
jgi:alkylation response protein AidB-like acyl-CoA dehydrogenase